MNSSHCIIKVMKSPISFCDLLYLVCPLYLSSIMIFGIKLFALLAQNCKQSTWPTIMSATILVLAVTDLSYPAPSVPPATCPTLLNASVAAATAATDAAKSTSCSFRVAQAAIVVAVCVWSSVCIYVCVFKWACVSFVGVATKRANECGKGKGSEVLKYFMFFFLHLTNVFVLEFCILILYLSIW